MMQGLVRDCQLLAGRLDQDPVCVLVRELGQIVSSHPFPAARREQLIVNGILTEMLAGLMRNGGPVSASELGPALLGLARPITSPEGMRARWILVVTQCEALVNTQRTTDGVLVPEPRVQTMLLMIAARYADSQLNVGMLAREVHLSRSHAVRLLKRQTGRGFVLNVNSRRVSAARRLVLSGALSMKEIAGVVGYRQPGQLSR